MQIDPAALAAATARNGVPVPALVQAMRAQIPADHAQYLLWGATSQDIMDTRLALRERRLKRMLARLGQTTDDHAHLRMSARTYGPLATLTGFGAVVVGWGRPLIEAFHDMESVRTAVLRCRWQVPRARFWPWATKVHRSGSGWRRRLTCATPATHGIVIAGAWPRLLH